MTATAESVVTSFREAQAYMAAIDPYRRAQFLQTNSAFWQTLRALPAGTIDELVVPADTDALGQAHAANVQVPGSWPETGPRMFRDCGATVLLDDMGSVRGVVETDKGLGYQLRYQKTGEDSLKTRALARAYGALGMILPRCLAGETSAYDFVKSADRIEAARRELPHAELCKGMGAAALIKVSHTSLVTMPGENFLTVGHSGAELTRGFHSRAFPTAGVVYEALGDDPVLEHPSVWNKAKNVLADVADITAGAKAALITDTFRNGQRDMGYEPEMLKMQLGEDLAFLLSRYQFHTSAGAVL